MGCHVKRFTSLVLVAIALAACNRGGNKDAMAIQTAPVARQNIVVDVEATGVIQPINTIQVRSKASGQIIKMPVQLGSVVKPGDLLVQIDPRQVQNVYNQSVAALQAANANVTVTKAQLDRALQLEKEGVITAPDLETAQLNYANARSQQATATTNLENAKIALEDATITAPSAGVVIEKDVSQGQVIASATNSPSGGTLLLQMADLSQVMDSTLVSESDIGHVRPGQQAQVKVDAYPNRTFTGTVAKITPQATVQQSVTMFPVLVHLANNDGALMPGMNSDVSVLVAQRDDVLTVPNDAIRSLSEAQPAAVALGLDPAQVQQAIRTQLASRGGAAPVVSGDTEAGVAIPDGAAESGRSGPSAPGGAPARSGTGTAGTRAGGAGGAGSTRGMAAGQANGTRNGAARGNTTGAGGSRAGNVVALQFGNPNPRPGLVFIAANNTFTPRVVTLGLGNYDATEVIAGLQPNERVALITSAMLIQARNARMQRIQGMTSLPGTGGGSQQSTNRGGGGGGGGGGGQRGGGGT
jgi:HlyD family secretion protein